jgi:hypothetical protein
MGHPAANHPNNEELSLGTPRARHRWDAAPDDLQVDVLKAQESKSDARKGLRVHLPRVFPTALAGASKIRYAVSRSFLRSVSLEPFCP